MASVQLTLCMVMKWKCYSDEAIQLSESQILPPLVPPSGNDDDFSFIGLFEQLGGKKATTKTIQTTMQFHQYKKLIGKTTEYCQQSHYYDLALVKVHFLGGCRMPRPFQKGHNIFIDAYNAIQGAVTLYNSHNMHINHR